MHKLPCINHFLIKRLQLLTVPSCGEFPAVRVSSRASLRRVTAVRKKNKIETNLVNSLVWHNAKDALTRLAITAHPTSFKKAHDGSIFIPNLISAFNVTDKYCFCHSYSQSILLSPYNCALKLSIIKVCRNVWPIWLDVWLIPHQFLLVDSIKDLLVSWSELLTTIRGSNFKMLIWAAQTLETLFFIPCFLSPVLSIFIQAFI